MNSSSPEALQAIVGAACSSDNLLVRLAGVSAGKFWSRGGLLRDWTVPESCADIERAMSTTGLEPLTVVRLLGTNDVEAPN